MFPLDILSHRMSVIGFFAKYFEQSRSSGKSSAAIDSSVGCNPMPSRKSVEVNFCSQCEDLGGYS